MGGQPHVGASLSHLEHTAGWFLTYSVRIHLPLGLRCPNYISFWLPQMPHFSSSPIAHPPPSLQWLQSSASASQVHNSGSKGHPGSLLPSPWSTKTFIVTIKQFAWKVWAGAQCRVFPSFLVVYQLQNFGPIFIKHGIFFIYFKKLTHVWNLKIVIL